MGLALVRRTVTAAVMLSLVARPSPALRLSAAADTLRGIVLDSAGQAIAAVDVLLPELSRRTATGPDGAFRFIDVPSGAWTVELRHPGFAPLVRRVTLPQVEDLRLTLARSIVQLEGLTVTATRSPADPLSSPLPTASLGSGTLSRAYGVSIAHALESLAGVRALTTGGEIGKPVIRGLSGARVLVLGDGNRLEDYSWSDEDGPSIETRLADRVEVIRGPASVLYGSDALGGVVNVIPQDVPDPRPAAGSFQARAEAYGASNNHEFGSAWHAQGATGGFGWLAGVVGRHSEALHTPAGELDNTGFTAFSGEGAIGTQGNWGKATARFTHYGGDFHLLEADSAPLPPPSSGGVDQGPVRKLTDDRLQLGGTFPAGRLRLEAKGQWQRHWLAETVAGDTGSTDQGFDLLLNTISVDLLAHHAGPRLAGTLGASGSYQSNDTRGDEPLVPDARTGGLAVFAFEQAMLSQRWSVLVGGRLDYRRLHADANADLASADAQRRYTAWSGDVGVVFRPLPRLALAANAGRAWRAPTLFELLTNGPHPGEARFEVGDAGLRPETGFNLDASVRWQTDRARGELAGFRNHIADYIYVAPTGTAQDSLPVYRYQQADARLWGGEVSFEVQAGAAVALSARLDFVRGERTSDRQPLPQIPPLRAKLGSAWRRGGATVGVDVDLVARQNRLSPYDVGTAGYGLLDLYGGIEPRLGGHPLRLEVQVRNALGTSYRDFLSRYKAFALNPGRNILVRVATDF
jgi:iron complex outermembrane receptor protein